MKVSILEDLDFKLELIPRDKINVAYFLKLLGKLRESKTAEKAQQKRMIIYLMGFEEVQLRQAGTHREVYRRAARPH